MPCTGHKIHRMVNKLGLFWMIGEMMTWCSSRPDLCHNITSNEGVVVHIVFLGPSPNHSLLFVEESLLYHNNSVIKQRGNINYIEIYFQPPFSTPA